MKSREGINWMGACCCSCMNKRRANSIGRGHYSLNHSLSTGLLVFVLYLKLVNMQPISKLDYVKLLQLLMTQFLASNSLAYWIMLKVENVW